MKSAVLIVVVCFAAVISSHSVYEDPPMGALPEDEFADIDDVLIEEQPAVPHKPMPKNGKDTHRQKRVAQKTSASDDMKSAQAKKLVSDHLAGPAAAKNIVDSVTKKPMKRKKLQSTKKAMASASAFEKKVNSYNKAAPKKAALKAARKAAKHAAHKIKQKAEKAAKTKAAKAAAKKLAKKSAKAAGKKKAKKAAKKGAKKKAKKSAKKAFKKAAKKAAKVKKEFKKKAKKAQKEAKKAAKKKKILMETYGRFNPHSASAERAAKNKASANANKRESEQKKADAAKEDVRKEKLVKKNADSCILTVYDGPNYTGHVLSRKVTCASKLSYHLPKSNRRRAYKASSFKLSSGCTKVMLWDEDKCRENYGDNVNIQTSVPKLTYDLNDDVCGVTVWANRHGNCRL